MDHIADFINKQSRITDLQLGYQNVWQAPKVSIISLAQALKKNKSVTSLSLARNKLNDEDAYLLAEAIGENSFIENINLSENKITDDGIVALAQSLESTPTLRELSLMKNPFGMVGYHAILNAVRRNHGLFQIKLMDHCFISQQIHYETALNRGGRKLLFEHPPLSLWPIALGRVNEIDFLGESNSYFGASKYCHRSDVIFYLLKGPAIFEGIICGEPTGALQPMNED
jgi:hypothetical protein